MRNTQRLVGIFSIVATYVLFLLWDQFGFLRRLESATDSDGIRIAMAAMGIAGLLASLATGFLLGRRSERSVLRAGFALAAVAVPVSQWADGLPMLSMAGAALGVATGLVTVSLASGLRRWLPGPNFAVAAGVGTGLAYFVCNIPWLFEGSGWVQGGFVSLLCLMAVGALTTFVPTAASTSECLGSLSPLGERARVRGRFDESSAAPSPQPSPRWGEGAKAAPPSRRLPWPELSLLLAFLSLVWLDSAAFAVIQETLTLKGATWATSGQKWIQGASHLMAAIAAGFLLRRGHLRSLLLAAYVLFGVAFQLLQAGGAGTLIAGPIYAVGISLYSTALVVAPSLVTPGATVRIPVRWRAAGLYGVAGWLGSALGVGMAQDLHRIPGLFIAASGVVLFLAWASIRPRTRALLSGFLRAHTLTLGGVAAAVLVFVVTPGGQADAGLHAEQDLIEQGRQVYIAEGCMGCHSQYVRPQHEGDQQLYGPHRPLDRSEAPPLIGLRRQGPDLSNVGQRHDADWLKHHLARPRDDRPESVMPSYAPLFDGHRDVEADTDSEPSRGDALVAYLLSLRPDEPAS